MEPADQQLALMDQIMNAVNSVPAGSIIRFVAYSFSWQPMADALIAAHKRGVQVRLLIDSHTETLARDRSPQLKTCAVPYDSTGASPATSGPASTAACQTAPRSSTPSSTCSRELGRREPCVDDVLGEPCGDRHQQVVEQHLYGRQQQDPLRRER